MVKLGPYAKTKDGSIETDRLEPPNQEERDAIQPLGKKYGCHFTGDKKLRHYSPDHQAPRALVKIARSNKYIRDLLKEHGVRVDKKMRLYPQDPRLNHAQGGVVKNLKTKLNKLIILKGTK